MLLDLCAELPKGQAMNGRPMAGENVPLAEKMIIPMESVNFDTRWT